MTAVQLWEALRLAGVEFTFTGEVLHYRAPPGVLSDDLRAAMWAHKADLLALLRPEVAPPGSTPGCLVPAGSTGEPVPTMPTSGAAEGSSGEAPRAEGADPGARNLLVSTLDAGATMRIPLDDLVCGDFLQRNRLRIVGGTAYPDGQTFRPTIYLADEAG
jgi:hypothetical protein